MTGDITNVTRTLGLRYATKLILGTTAKRNVYHKTTTQGTTFVTMMGRKYVAMVRMQFLAFAESPLLISSGCLFCLFPFDLDNCPERLKRYSVVDTELKYSVFEIVILCAVYLSCTCIPVFL